MAKSQFHDRSEAEVIGARRVPTGCKQPTSSKSHVAHRGRSEAKDSKNTLRIATGAKRRTLAAIGDAGALECQT
jgi:hypothetical protein